MPGREEEGSRGSTTLDGALAARNDYSGRMPRGSTLGRLALAGAVASAGGAASLARAATEAAPSAVAASGSSSSTGADLAGAGVAASSSSAPAPAHRRRHEEPVEVELIDLTDGPQPDPQALAVGLTAGPAVFHTRGSQGVSAAADFSFTFEAGLGPGGARAPWSVQAFVSFAVTRASLASDVQVFPDRWTEVGVRAIYRGIPGSGLLDGRWLSLGLGAVWTSWGSCEAGSDLVVVNSLGFVECTSRHEIAPGGLIDVGVGLQEWSTRFARYGFGVRAPFELTSHWGWGAVAFFYAQLGLGR